MNIIVLSLRYMEYKFHIIAISTETWFNEISWDGNEVGPKSF